VAFLKAVNLEFEMSDRIIGILGGMGPEATADLYREITALTPAEKDQDHVRVLIYSNPKIPDRTRAVVDQGEDPLPQLIESAKLLERAGAGILAIPCNAAHHFVPGLQAHIGIPILNMVEETCREFCRRLPGARAVGLLAATGTIRSGIYRGAFATRSVSTIEPPLAEQDEVQSAILKVKAGCHDSAIREVFQNAGGRLDSRGAAAVILGCTEIPLAFDPEAVGYLTLNPTRILAGAALAWALGGSL
jgi:aspartate racemase